MAVTGIYDVLYINWADPTKPSGKDGVDLSGCVAKSGLKVAKEWLVADSGRNAKGTMVFRPITTKYKVTATLSPMTPGAAALLLGPVVNHYTDLEVHFMNPYTNTMTQMQAYVGSQSIQFMTLASVIEQTSPITISFIEL